MKYSAEAMALIPRRGLVQKARSEWSLVGLTIEMR
jgi:hypothetical protein